MKIALVYDRVTKIGGAERVLTALHSIWPEAPIFTSVYDRILAPWSSNWNVNPSFLQYIPTIKYHHEVFPWIMPLAFETFRFDEYDVVLSVTSAEAKSVITKPHTLHICYCLTPTRYLWSHYKEYQDQMRSSYMGIFGKTIFDTILPVLRNWDILSSRRPDKFIAISHHVRRRIEKYYQQYNSIVVYPPVDDVFFNRTNNIPRKGSYFLLVSRLVFYKRHDIVIQAFNKLGLPLVVIGDGAYKKKLVAMASRNIRFISRYLTDDELVGYYQNCRAFIFAGEEDFGIVALEALACGKPVVAYRKSGISEVVTDGRTGVLFNDQSVDSLCMAVQQCESMNIQSKHCRNTALQFSLTYFKKKMRQTVESLYRDYNKNI